jgi:hypothetical protein
LSANKTFIITCAFQHQNKFSESNAKATRARNDYILSMVTANAAIRRFIVDDLPELINVSKIFSGLYKEFTDHSL